MLVLLLLLLLLPLPLPPRPRPLLSALGIEKTETSSGLISKNDELWL